MAKKNKKQHLINQEITFKEVRVSDEGIMSLDDALKLAESKFMDLVLMNQTAEPPVCKIMSYEKYIYNLNKTSKNKYLEVKEIKIGPNTAENDLDYRSKHIIEFLKSGHKVKISMQFRGRELSHLDNGKAIMLKLILSVEDFGIAESLPTMEGKKMFATIKPISKK